ncbi:hypothetical protein GGP41_010203 [Bipolaris sorokiniana]|uniref:Uncharacterized protein n=1 Tax=Cochliobolus sativus TaxID=45130 RepID=A0A8H5ZM29_COCSA|nr:hypothetical protein GGP41_010203 [Bipolaris sorokiniana]
MAFGTGHVHTWSAYSVAHGGEGQTKPRQAMGCQNRVWVKPLGVAMGQWCAPRRHSHWRWAGHPVGALPPCTRACPGWLRSAETQMQTESSGSSRAATTASLPLECKSDIPQAACCSVRPSTSQPTLIHMSCWAIPSNTIKLWPRWKLRARVQRICTHGRVY